MKEQKSLSETDSLQLDQRESKKETKKMRLEKKRTIRKLKNFNEDIINLSTVKNLKELTNNQRNERQKLKNREAAQKSRENKKYFLNRLLKQNEQLKNKLAQNKICEKCKREIKQVSFFLNEEENVYDDQMIRIDNFEEPSSIGMFLVVCMIIVCFITVIGTYPGTKRYLLQNNSIYPNYLSSEPNEAIVKFSSALNQQKELNNSQKQYLTHFQHQQINYLQIQQKQQKSIFYELDQQKQINFQNKFIPFYENQCLLEQQKDIFKSVTSIISTGKQLPTFFETYAINSSFCNSFIKILPQKLQKIDS